MSLALSTFVISRTLRTLLARERSTMPDRPAQFREIGAGQRDTGWEVCDRICKLYGWKQRP
jgi:hypothetical protein